MWLFYLFAIGAFALVLILALPKRQVTVLVEEFDVTLNPCHELCWVWKWIFSGSCVSDPVVDSFATELELLGLRGRFSSSCYQTNPLAAEPSSLRTTLVELKRHPGQPEYIYPKKSCFLNLSANGIFRVRIKNTRLLEHLYNIFIELKCDLRLSLLYLLLF